MIGAIEWPTSDRQWWWMRYRTTPRANWRVLLVELIEHDGRAYIKPFDDRNCFPRTICEDWKAQFVPAEPPPEEWC